MSGVTRAFSRILSGTAAVGRAIWRTVSPVSRVRRPRPKDEILAARVRQLMRGIESRTQSTDLRAAPGPIFKPPAYEPLVSSAAPIASGPGPVDGPPAAIIPPITWADELLPVAPIFKPVFEQPLDVRAMGRFAGSIVSISDAAHSAARTVKTRLFRREGGWTDRRLDHMRIIDGVGLRAAVEISQHCRDVFSARSRGVSLRPEDAEVFSTFLDRLSAQGWLHTRAY